MTTEEALKEIKERIHIAEYVGDSYADCVEIKALNIAISAMEKQIPQKPVMGYAFPEKLREVMKRTDPEKAEVKTDCCPICGRTLGVSKFVQTQTGLRFGDPHCKRCGQAIDWEGEG